MVLVIIVLQTFLCTKTEKIYKLTTNYNCSQASMGFQKVYFVLNMQVFDYKDLKINKVVIQRCILDSDIFVLLLQFLKL